MKPDEIQYLLGGYATGTLTPEEQKTLFAAALQDQSLFDSLTREQALKDVLDAPSARRELLEILEPARSWREQVRIWSRWQFPLAATGVVAAALTVFAIARYDKTVGHAIPASTSQVAVAHRPADAAPIPQLDKQERRTAPVPAQVAPQSSRPPASSARTAEAIAAENKLVAPAQKTALMAAEEGVAAGSSRGARDLFYGSISQPADRGAVADDRRMEQSRPQVLGLRYSGASAPGAPPRLVVESNSDAVLYIFRRDEAGAWLPVIFGGTSLRARTPVTSPGIEVNGDAPRPRVLLVLSRTPIPELAQSGGELSVTLDKLSLQSNTPDLLTQIGSGSTYVVMPLADAGSRLVVQVEVR